VLIPCASQRMKARLSRGICLKLRADSRSLPVATSGQESAIADKRPGPAEHR
jgi:hypothetical protein